MPFCLQQFAAGFDSAHFRRHIQAKLKRRNCLRQFAASHLSQGQVNGHFYDKNGRLTIFDDESSGNVKGLLIREDALNAFLNSCDYDLIWVCQANKLFKVNAGRTEYVQSEWSGLYSYNNGNVNGKLNCMGVYPRDINK